MTAATTHALCVRFTPVFCVPVRRVQIKGEGLNFVIEAFGGNIARLATHPYGCRVVQRILEHCAPEHTAMVLAEVMLDIEPLLQHQYGNYVIQCILEHGRPEHKSAIIDTVMGRITYFARHKFASNVVERCLEYGSAREKAAIVDEVMAPTLAAVAAHPEHRLPDERSPAITPLQVLLADPFGNYVAQKLLDVADDRQRAAMLEMLKAYAPTLRKYQHGRHLLARIEKMASKLVLGGPGPTLPVTRADRSAATSGGGSYHSSSPSGVSPHPHGGYHPSPASGPSSRASPLGLISGSTPSPLYSMMPPQAVSAQQPYFVPAANFRS